MERPTRQYAASGLALIVLSWVWVSLVEILGSDRLAMPLLRIAGVLVLTAAIVKGNRAASGVLLVWSIVGITLRGFMGALLVLVAGVVLFLAVGGSTAFRPPGPANESEKPPVVG